MSQVRPNTAASLGELVGGLAGDVQDLVRGEIALARSEFEQKIGRVSNAAIWLLGGGLLAFAGLVVLLQGVAVLLALAMPAWLAFLLVGILVVVIGGALAKSGLGLLTAESLAPDRTAANLQKDAHMVKEHI